MGAQKNHLNETVLFSTHNICFSGEIRKSIFINEILTRGLVYKMNEKSLRYTCSKIIKFLAKVILKLEYQTWQIQVILFC